MSESDTTDEMKIAFKAELHRRHLWLIENYGERCTDYFADCIICKMWRNHDNFKALIYDF